MIAESPPKVNKRAPRYVTHLLRPLAAEEFDQSPYGVIDIETGKPGDNQPLGGTFVVAMLYDGQTEQVFYTIESVIEAMQAKRYRGYTWYAHNGMRYDWTYFIREVRLHPDRYPGLVLDFVCRGDKTPIVITMRKNKQCVKIVDTFNLFQVSLSKLTKSFAPEYLKKEREWEQKDGTWNWFDPCDRTDMEYLRYDCLGLFLAVANIRELLYSQFGVNPRLTAASTSMAAWRRSLPDTFALWRQRPEVEHFCRQAYHGGYVYPGTIRKQENMTHVDVNAMFAAGMRDGVPIGAASYEEEEHPTLPGFYLVDITVPDTERYPWVPLTTKQGTIYPRGQFRTYLSSKGLAYARELGYDYSVVYGYVFVHGIQPIFNEFLDKCETLELAHKGTPIGDLAKLMRNSLYGKFGQHELGTKLTIAEYSDEQPYIDPQTGAPEDGLFVEQKAIVAPYMNVHIAAWITETARITINKFARVSDAIYCDTDSAVFPTEKRDWLEANGFLKIGKAYGEYKIEHEYEWFWVVCPKNYIGKCTDGSFVHKAKGIARSVADVEKGLLAAQGTPPETQYDSMRSMWSVIRKPDGDLVIRAKRKYSTLLGSHGWYADEDGLCWSRKTDFIRNSETRENSCQNPLTNTAICGIISLSRAEDEKHEQPSERARPSSPTRPTGIDPGTSQVGNKRSRTS